MKGPCGSRAVLYSLPRSRFDSVSALLSLQKLWFVDTVFVMLPITMSETSKRLSSLSRSGSGGDSVCRN